jgi:hypothetical protein
LATNVATGSIESERRCDSVGHGFDWEITSPSVKLIGMMKTFTLTAALLCFAAGSRATAEDPFSIRVVDSENGWPVPLVELRTTHHVRFVSDNAGTIAFDLPELMGVETWFHVIGHGYTVPKDGFGFRGVRLTPRPGRQVTIRVQRQYPAKRLGRITGGGLFAESQRLGRFGDWTEQGILGCDSVHNAVYRSKLFWLWGDTTLPGYPLGRFHTIGATTDVQPIETFQPPIRLRYRYFSDAKGVPGNIAEMPGEGPTWLSGLISLKDADGRERLCAVYSKIRPPLSEHERGLCVWDDARQRFDRLQVLWQSSESSDGPPPAPIGHPVVWSDAGGNRWALFGDPFPSLRCPATFEAWSDPGRWQTLDSQPRVPVKDSARSVQPHRGAIAYSKFRKRWITVFTQLGGDSSHLGEIWFAESEAPEGPWGEAVKIVSHDAYTFYNPQVHVEMTGADSRVLLFEATYTRAFSKSQHPTPRHDYNQVLYRLDLDEL